MPHKLLLSRYPNLKPMLAEKAKLDKLVFPLMASPKLDGIRCLVGTGKVFSRSLKLIPNRHIQSLLGSNQFDGLDGELIIGEPNAVDVYRVTESGVMSRDGEPAATFWVFDQFDRDGGFMPTYVVLAARELPPFIKVLRQTFIANMDELLAYEEGTLALGYEGVMLRRPMAPYKFGRSTVAQGYLLKRKPLESSEFVVIGIEPKMHNTNEAETNELGRTKRSTAAEGLVPMETMGALKVQDIHNGKKFNIGVGFTDADRLSFWQRWHDGALGPDDIFTYDYQGIGAYDLPRTPVYKGPRKSLDMS